MKLVQLDNKYQKDLNELFELSGKDWNYTFMFLFQKGIEIVDFKFDVDLDKDHLMIEAAQTFIPGAESVLCKGEVLPLIFDPDLEDLVEHAA